MPEDDIELKRANVGLNNKLYSRFNMGTRDKGDRTITPPAATKRLSGTLKALKISPTSQTQIINDLTEGVEGVYQRATHNYNVPDSVMGLGAKFWIYSTAIFAIFDKLTGKIK